MNKSIVILGSTGMLGQALSKRSSELGYTTVGIARKKSDINLDLTNTEELFAQLNKIKPSIIINSAAYINLNSINDEFNLAYLLNTKLVSLLTNYCMKMDIKLCQISTDHFFTGDADALHTEKSEVKIVNEYARTKYAGECFALTHSVNMVIRTNIVGFRGWENELTFVEWVIHNLKKNEKMTLFKDFYTSSLDVDSFSKALFDLIEVNYSGLINLASSEVSNKLTFVRCLAQKLGFDLQNFTIGSVNSIQGEVRAESLGLDVSLAESTLGYKLPKLNEVLENLKNQYEGT